MRPIKFRAWDTHFKSWILPTDVRIDGEGKVYIFDDEQQEWGEDRIGQAKILFSTFLKDKNGKEIYEGDIIKSKRFPEPQIAEWSIFYDGHCCCSEQHSGFVFSCDSEKDLEIIGNIYENPELLHKEE